jgi:competence protein ComFC
VLSTFFKWLGETLFPTYCCYCYKLGRYLCWDCFERLEFLGAPHPLKLENSYLDSVIAAVRYQPPITTLLHMMKYDGIPSIAEYCGELLYETTFFELPDCITAVPLHPKRQWWRGFNQAEVIAKRVAEKCKVPYHSLLQRQSYTSAQATLHRKDRIKNLNKAFDIHFKLKKRKLPFKKVLIIDDVVTTGTTLNECAKILKEHGVEKVYGLVVAHGS